MMLTDENTIGFHHTYSLPRMAPVIGGPMRDAIPTGAKAMPIRCPMSEPWKLMSTIMGRYKEMIDPNKKP
jgi:hypothetical protein